MKKKSTGKTVERSTSDLAVSRKLLQLNLHQALKYNFQAHHILDDLKQKQKSDSIFGKAYIAESVIRLNEALFGNCFHLNALAEGRRTDLFSRLDSLKARINVLIDNPSSRSVEEPDGEPTIDEDDVLLLLSSLIKETDGPDRPPNDTSVVPFSETPSVGEMLGHLSEQTLELANRQLDATVDPAAQKSEGITVIPVGYVNVPPAEADCSISITPSPENETVRMIIEGLNVIDSLPGDRDRARTVELSDLHTTVLHSAHETSQFARAGAFRSVIGAAVFDDAAGNFIYLMIAPGKDKERSEPVRRLLLKSLYWLDFDTTDHRQIICAGIKNLTREEMGDHLNMLGKLLAFAASVSDSLQDEQSIQINVEYFLETVI